MRQALIIVSGFAIMIIPATAQMSTDEAMQICRNQVRQDASGRFGSDVDFRSTSMQKYGGVRDQVEGTFALQSGPGPEIHTFACSVDLATGNLRWERIDSPKEFNSPANSANRAVSSEAQANPSAGSGDRTAYTHTEAIDMCRNVVRGKIHDHGYIGADFNSINVENTPNGATLIAGKVTGETGGHENLFNFSCEINRTTGAVKMLELNGH
jgi:hypothetical protein